MDLSRQIITQNAEETAEIGKDFGTQLKEQGSTIPRVLCFFGDLGSGKTTFIQGMAKGLGIRQRLLSPTFLIVRRYTLSDQDRYFYHIDLYRVKSAADIESVGISEILENPANITAIEWSDKLHVLPARRIEFYFEILDGNRRKIDIKKYE